MSEEKNQDSKHDKDFVYEYNRKKYSLKLMLALVTKENLHSEIDSGKPVGNEIW